jgi:hypothetical protein
VSDARSPKVLSVSWGEVVVEGLGSFKDVKLWPGGGRAWDWTETGTRHQPGIQRADVGELLEHGARVVVLSRGMERRLLTLQDTLDHLVELGCDVHVEETQAAVELYNQVARSQPAGCLIHSTC